MVLDPVSMRARGCGPFEGLLHTRSTHKNTKKRCNWCAFLSFCLHFRHSFLSSFLGRGLMYGTAHGCSTKR